MSGSPAAPGPSHDSLDSSPPAPGFRSYQQTKLAELALDSSVPPATAPTAPPGSQPFPSPPPESPPPAPTPTPAPAATGPLPTTPPPPATGPLIPTPAWPVSAPYSQPASSSGAPADKSVAGIAAGSAAAGAVLIVLLVAFGLYVVAPIWKRRTGRDRAGAGSSGGGGASQHESQKHHSVVQIEVEVTTPMPTASSSSALGSSSSWATSRESHKPDTHGDGAGPRVQPVPGAGGGDEVLFRGAFTYEQLAAATDGFSESSLVGRGGFGDVHVGTVDGAAVAVKRLRAGSQQGDREFQAELRIISRVHHRNLVSLVGYCVGDGGQRLLVYEFVPNLTLHHHLHAFSATGEVETVLDWPTRWKIAVGAAKGLAYLHEDCHPRIIHRDIKAANILLDPDFNPKVSDFGMAKFVPRGDTHIATRIVGTIGYLAPEYATSGRLTEKSDVFSFGVVLLELVTGMKAAMSSDPDDREEGTLVGWARPLLTKALELPHDYDELVDPLLPSFDAKQMACLVRCAAAAVSTSARHRPRMSQIVKHLEGDDASSEEEIDAGGAEPLGQSGSTHGRPGGDTSAQFHSYSKIRTSRWEARALGHRTEPEQSLLKSSNPIIKKRL